MAKGWHRLTIEEKFRKSQETRLQVKVVRCIHCKITVPEKEREGHIGRCTEVVRLRVTFARGGPMDEHFEEPNKKPPSSHQLLKAGRPTRGQAKCHRCQDDVARGLLSNVDSDGNLLCAVCFKELM